MTTELGLIVVAAAAFAFWPRVASTVSTPILDSLALPDSLLVDGLVTGSFLLAGLCLFTGAYATLRDIEVGTELPTGGDLRLAGLALLTPAALVGLTKSVGVLTGVSYGSLTKTYVAADASVEPVLVVTGLGLFIGVPSFLLLCHVVVQGSFEKVVDGEVAVVATTAVTGFLLTSNAGNLSAFPDRGKLAGAALFVLAIGVASYATEEVRRQWLLVLAYLPAILLVGVAVVSGVAGVKSVAGALFAFTQVAVLGLAAYAYERTDSLLVPALAYASFSVTGSVIFFVFEAGIHG
jgi:hypothetical protein